MYDFFWEWLSLVLKVFLCGVRCAYCNKEQAEVVFCAELGLDSCECDWCGEVNVIDGEKFVLVKR